MALHFTREEFADRQRRTRAEMAKAGLEGLLIFRQESMYYLTGYDTSGYSMFQGMYLGADGALALLTRSADQRQARLTSVIEDIRIWTDREGADPAAELRDMVADYGGRGKRIGAEYHAYGFTAQRGKMVDAAFAGFCELVDASDLVQLLRLVKSPAELALLRQAGRLVDEACAVSQHMTVPGASIGAVYGEMMSTIMRGDGDPTASRWPMGAGEEALMVRYHTGHGTVAPRDQVQFEIAAAYRHYHAALMYVILTGAPDPRHRHMFDACAKALDACEAGVAARQHGRRSVRGACRGSDKGRLCRPFPQCLRLYDGGDLSADLDGLADGLCRRAAGAGAEHGVLSAHDPAQQRHRVEHVARRNRDHHQSRLRADQPRPARSAGREGLRRVSGAPAPLSQSRAQDGFDG
jgi:Xaa-Pro dipeptidase